MFSQVPTIIPLSHSPLSPTFQVQSCISSIIFFRTICLDSFIIDASIILVAGPVYWLPPSYRPPTHPSSLLMVFKMGKKSSTNKPTDNQF